MKPSYAELEKRVAELEAKVKALGSVTHNHYFYAPAPVYQPLEPNPYPSTCGGSCELGAFSGIPQNVC